MKNKTKAKKQNVDSSSCNDFLFFGDQNKKSLRLKSFHLIYAHKFAPNSFKYEIKNFIARQREIINCLLGSFYGKLTVAKWARICKCSEAVARADIEFLVTKGVLIRDDCFKKASFRLNLLNIAQD